MATFTCRFRSIPTCFGKALTRLCIFYQCDVIWPGRQCQSPKFSHEKPSRSDRENPLLKCWAFLSLLDWEAREKVGLGYQGDPSHMRARGADEAGCGDLLRETALWRGGGRTGATCWEETTGQMSDSREMSLLPRGRRGRKVCFPGIWGKLSVVCAG